MNNNNIRPEWIPSAYTKKGEKLNLNSCKDLLFGVAIGDALGVPVEFKSREEISRQPVTDMIGYGTHNQPAGTFSDDSSLAFCLAEAIASRFTLEGIARNFINWRYQLSPPYSIAALITMSLQYTCTGYKSCSK